MKTLIPAINDARPHSRRQLLRGLAAAPVAVAAGASAGLLMSQARASTSADAALLAAFAKWQACLVEYDAAAEALDEASDRVVWPDPPEELFIRRGDNMGLVAMSTRNVDGRRWLGDADRIEYLRQAYVADAAEEQLSPQTHARACAIVQAYEVWMAEEKAAEAAAGVPQAEERDRRIVVLNNDLRRAIANMPAHTLEGVLAKAEVAAWCIGDPAELEGSTADGFSADGDDMQVSILRDLVRMGGEA